MPSDSPENQHNEDRQLQVALVEVQVVFGQMHQRMSGISALIGLGAALFAFCVGFVVSDLKLEDPTRDTYAIMSLGIPFFILGVLLFREDFMMQSHDRYLLQHLRPMILKLCDQSSDDNFSAPLGFLHSMKELKVSNPTFAILGVFRYCFPFAGLAFLIVVVNLRGAEYETSATLICTLILGGMALILSWLLVQVGRLAKENLS